jgi:hypothetical protein
VGPQVALRRRLASGLRRRTAHLGEIQLPPNLAATIGSALWMHCVLFSTIHRGVWEKSGRDGHGSCPASIRSEEAWISLSNASPLTHTGGTPSLGQRHAHQASREERRPRPIFLPVCSVIAVYSSPRRGEVTTKSFRHHPQRATDALWDFQYNPSGGLGEIGVKRTWQPSVVALHGSCTACTAGCRPAQTMQHTRAHTQAYWI